MIVVGLVAVFGANTVIDTAKDLASDVLNKDPVLIDEPGYQLLAGGEGEGKVRQCTAQVALTTRQCGDLKVLIIDAAKMSFIARNIKLALAEGQPTILHRESANTRSKRGKACGSFKKTYPRGSCDEFSFASSREGGADGGSARG